MAQAQAVNLKVETIVVAQLSCGVMDAEAARWLNEVGDKLHRKLVKVGLATSREVVATTGATLGAFIDSYIAARSTAKWRTVDIWKIVRRNLVSYFGEVKPIADITPGDADDWCEHMRTSFAPATAGRRAKIGKQFFRWGARKELLPRNPFEGIATPCPENRDRTVFVTRAMADKVLAACPDTQWRLIFALCRFGGLRCPSEVLGVRWGDVDWEHGRILIHSPKTEHHEGKESRLIPIFPELRPCLQDAFDLAEPGTEYVVTAYRNGENTNLRDKLAAIITKAGLEPWPKLFINLRSTRETELAECWPVHVVCAWLGNSAMIAKRHYLQVTDEHFERAAKNGTESGTVTSAQARNEPQRDEADKSESPMISDPCEKLQPSATASENDKHSFWDSRPAS
jgi:integrase